MRGKAGPDRPAPGSLLSSPSSGPPGAPVVGSHASLLHPRRGEGTPDPRPFLTHRRPILPGMDEGPTRKLRSHETWRAVRRAWEAGETGASLARRFDVGLANLWRRRASEGWERGREADPDPEPPEGWERYAQRKQGEFELRLEEARLLATKLAEAMAGGGLEGVPLWHVGFVLAWRAEHLGAETAARDRDWMRRYGWSGAFWDADGRLWNVGYLDAVTLEANRAEWREDMGLPEGAAEGWP